MEIIDACQWNMTLNWTQGLNRISGLFHLWYIDFIQIIYNTTLSTQCLSFWQAFLSAVRPLLRVWLFLYIIFAIFPLFYNVFTVNRKLKLHVETSETVNMWKKLVVDCFKYAGKQKHTRTNKHLIIDKKFRLVLLSPTGKTFRVKLICSNDGWWFFVACN